MTQPLSRLQSINVFRAVTMFLMVFVNDLDPIPNVPIWIKHVGEHVDGLGFADIIFPAFLFIVGLSIPFAIRNRLSKGDTRAQVLMYIGLRALALLIMGFFHVNLEDYDRSVAFPKAAWEICITLGFFAIWLDYPKDMPRNRRLLIQAGGVLMLIAMAFLYHGGTPAAPEGLSPQWWGILGLIGWSYLICASIFLLTNGNFQVQIFAALFFLGFSVLAHAHLLGALSGIHHYVWIVGSGAMPALTMGGIVTVMLYTYALDHKKNFLPVSFLLGVGLIGLGFLLRSFGGISKLHDTPSWVSICMGISVCAFGLFTWLIDVKGQTAWFKWVMPAGTSTLTCYLVPYLLYSIYMLCGMKKFPHPFDEGTGGLLKAIVTAIVVVLITGWLERRRLRLKI